MKMGRLLHSSRSAEADLRPLLKENSRIRAGFRYKSMGDFVKNCVSNFGGSVQIGQHTAYGNLPLAPVAATKTSHRSVESKTPLRSQAMLDHQLFGKDFSFTEIHVIILLCVSPSERHDTNKLVKVTAGDESTCQHWHGP